MMENWVADSKRGPLRHTPQRGAQRHSTKKSEDLRRSDRDTLQQNGRHPEKVSHNTDHGATWLTESLRRRAARRRARPFVRVALAEPLVVGETRSTTLLVAVSVCRVRLK